MTLAVALVAATLALVFVVARREAPPSASDGVQPGPAPAAAVASGLAVPSDAADRAGAANAGAPTIAADDGLEVVVATRDSAMPSGRAVPRIRVVVGVGTPPIGAPNEGIVRAGLELDASRADLRTVTTGDDGRATLRIPRAEVEAARSQRDPSVWARVVEPGYQQRTLRKPLGDDAAGAIEVALIAFRGRTLRGRVVDADGAPVAARVTASAPDVQGRVGIGATSRSGADGWFELMPFRGGVQHLLAEAGDLGTGAVRDLDVDAVASEPIVLRVSGPGVVRGRVRDAVGNGVPGLELGVWMASLDDDAGSFVLAEPGHTHARLEGRGRAWATVRTAADGSFEARGLRADRYVVRAGASSHGPFPRLLTPAPVASDGVELDLRLERTVLAVRTVDSRGDPWTGAVESGRTSSSFDDGRIGAPASWPEHVTLVVLPVASDAARGDPLRPRFLGSRDDAGVHVVPCVPGARYRVGLMGGNERWRPVEVDVPALAGRVDVTLVPTFDAALGSLVVQARGASGAALTSEYSIRVEDVDGGETLVLDEVDRWESGSGARRLPAGSYRVVVRAEPFVDDHHGTLMESAMLGSFESIVTIRQDETTTLVALLPAGARIRAKITGAALDEDTAAVRARCPSCALDFDAGFWIEQAATALHADGRWPIAVRFPWELETTSGAGTHLDAWLRVGRQGTSELLPAGRYRFEARMPGGRTASKVVDLVDGTTTDVELAIPPR